MKSCSKCGKEYENFYIACPKCDLGQPKKNREVNGFSKFYEEKVSYTKKSRKRTVIIFTLMFSCFYLAGRFDGIIGFVFAISTVIFMLLGIRNMLRWFTVAINRRYFWRV